MRADMGKVLVERPRLRNHSGDSRPGKGYAKQARKGLDAGDAPAREGMKRRYGIHRKFFNENLAPLRRFLSANVGRPWDAVYAEICEHVDRGNVVQKHVLTHLFDYVAVHTVLIGGEPCRGEGHRYGESLRTCRWGHQWYVCPKSGLLRASRRVRRPGFREEEARRRAALAARPAPVAAGDWLVCCWNGDGWDLVELAPLPAPTTDWLGVRDPAAAEREAARREFGKVGREVSRRRLTRKELKNYPIPMDLWAGRRDRPVTRPARGSGRSRPSA